MYYIIHILSSQLYISLCRLLSIHLRFLSFSHSFHEQCTFTKDNYLEDFLWEKKWMVNSAHCCHLLPLETRVDFLTQLVDRGRFLRSSFPDLFPGDASPHPVSFYSIVFLIAPSSVEDVFYILCHLKRMWKYCK